MANHVDLKIHSAPFLRALEQRARDSKRGAFFEIRKEAGYFVRDCILLTPPNKNLKQNRKGGEIAIKADIHKIFRGVRANAKGAINNPDAVHEQWRSRSGGRVEKELPNFGLYRKFKVANLPAFIAKQILDVGILASGWTAAAHKLGVKVPPWISRHGTRGGSMDVKISLSETRIRIVNSVRFVGNVKGLARRIRLALDMRAGAMERQIKNHQARLDRRPL